MIVLRNINFSEKEEKDKKKKRDPKPRFNELRPMGPISTAALGTGLVVAPRAIMGAQVAGAMELDDMYKEMVNNINNSSISGDPRGRAAVHTINSDPMKFQEEFLKRAKAAKPKKGKLLNRYNRARFKGALKSSAIPLSITGVLTYNSMKNKKKYEKKKKDYERELEEWKERNNK